MNENVSKKATNLMESDFIDTTPIYLRTQAMRDNQVIGITRELIQLGIKIDRIDKAIAACGPSTTQSDLIKWLINHSKDPMLTSDFTGPTREFILLLCPIKRLASEIKSFLSESRECFGSNEAHFNCTLPYMKLSSFFKIHDSQVSNLHRLFDSFFKYNSQEINLDLHVTPKMVVLYPDLESEQKIKEQVSSFSRLTSKFTPQSCVPYSKQLHLRLAYQFKCEHAHAIKETALKHINFKRQSDWELRLYSRDIRLDEKQLIKVISKGVVDYLYVDPRIMNNRLLNTNEILNGISHKTGESVIFQSKYAERVSETDAWQMHKSQLYAQNEKTSQQAPKELKFVLMRHAERVDLVFGPQWIDTCFDRNNNYKRTNLNMPFELPKRQSKREFINDSPITEIGKSQARLTGEALSQESYSFQYCYVSPSLRSIQTAHHVLEAMNLQKTCKIRIEPSLFEFLGWYEKEMPTFMHFDALLNFGFNIDTHYKPLMTVDRLQFDEKFTDYYLRSFHLMKHLGNLHAREASGVLLVGHAATLEVCSRQITGAPVRSYAEFNSVIRKVPYLGCCLVNKTNDQMMYELQPTGIDPLTHSGTFNFDANVLK